MKKTILSILVFLSINAVYANNAWNGNFTYHGKKYDATTTGGIKQTINVNGSQVTIKVDPNNCYKNPTGKWTDDCDRSIRRTQLRSHSSVGMGQDTKYNFSVNKLHTHGDANRGGYINFFEIKPYTDGKTSTVPTVALYVNPKTNNMNVIQSLGNHGANPAAQNDIYKSIGRLKNGWNNFRIDTKQSTGADGYVKIYQNGKLIYSYKGKTSYPHNRPIKYWFGGYICCGQINQLLQNGEPDHVFQYTNVSAGPVSSSGSNSPTLNNNSGSDNNTFSKYVNAYGDLNAAFNNGLQPGKSKAEFGQWHYCNYGIGEGRTSAGMSLAACKVSLDTKTPDIDTNVDEMDNGLGGGRFTDEITTGIKRFSKVAVFNGDVFSFKDYYTFKAYEVNDTQGLMLGFSKRQESDGSTDDPVGIGWLFDNVALMVAQDNSMLGYDAQGIFDFIDPSTTYIDIGHRKTFADNITLFTDLIYAYGRSSDGDLVALSDIHALGFESKLEYVANDANIFVFKFDLPLHIEDGSSRFIVSQFGQPVPLNIGLVPDGREMRLSLGNDFRLFESSMITSRFMYTRDPDHRRGRSDYQFDIRYRFEY